MQQFWTSRTFWTILLGFLFNLLVAIEVIPVGTDVTIIVDGILSLLAIVFRWQAQGPLKK